MTDEWIPRGKELPKNELVPQGARQKEILARIVVILLRRGLAPQDALDVGLDIWRETRRQ